MPSASYSPFTRIWLELDAFSTVNHVVNTGRVGEFTRAESNGWTDETLLHFLDVSALGGSTVTKVTLDVVATVGGSPPSVSGYCYDQNKTAPDSWSSPPRFADFAQTPWDTAVSWKPAFNTATTHVFPSTGGFVDLVQSWIDDDSTNWGLVLGVAFGAIDYYLVISDATLYVEYTGGAVPQAMHHFRQRRT